MKVSVNITSLEYANHIANYWSNTDYIKLLKLFDFADAEQVANDEIKDMLYMAISDFEPEDAAEIVLTYKLSDQLSAGQIQSISHEMREDKVAEEYPEPELHYDLFNVNQLLYKAYNGTFPNTEASIIHIELPDGLGGGLAMTEEIMTKLVSDGLVDKCLLKRLYSDQLEGKVPFTDANKFIWTLKEVSKNKYELLTSRYWIEKEDIASADYESNVVMHEEH